MGFKRELVRSVAFLLLLSLAFSTFALADKKDKKKAVRGTPVLWREPVDIASRNLFYGPGGRSMVPDTSRVTFIEEEKGGYSKKYRVRDGRGRIWVAKVGKEAQPETAANRLLWAAGYNTEITYLVPRVTIAGKGTFENVRFEARPANIKRLDEWEWDHNPFVGRRELQGLKVMMVLVNNWDIKDSNNKVLFVPGSRQLRYIVSDMGATFGKTGSFLTRSRNKPGDYVNAEFIDEIEGRYVDFHYSGKRKEIFRNITNAEARWMGQILSRLSRRQIADAFRAANYSAQDIRALTDEVSERIRDLVALPLQRR